MGAIPISPVPCSPTYRGSTVPLSTNCSKYQSNVSTNSVYSRIHWYLREYNGIYANTLVYIYTNLTEWEILSDYICD